MKIAACCPASFPSLVGSHDPLEYFDVTAGQSTKTESPKTPVSRANGWMPLINSKNIWMEGSKVPQAYVDGKCHMV
jgi:hypothetical protein